jgi:hypothetical protein
MNVCVYKKKLDFIGKNVYFPQLVRKVNNNEL